MNMIHSFKESLEQSAEVALESWWEEIYRQYFPHFLSMSAPIKDGWGQRAGIDRVILLKSGKQIKIDEKVRYADYGDVLIEYWSDKERKIPGWGVRELDCDYIAYAVLPTKTCFMLPFDHLQAAVYNNADEWIKQYGGIQTANQNYTTISMAVPLKVLYDAMNNAGQVQWNGQ